MTKQYEIGSRAKSHETSSDVQMMGAVWHCEIVEVVGSVNGGEDTCYRTVGHWEVVDQSKTMGIFDDYDPSVLTERQLWGKDLTVAIGL